MLGHFHCRYVGINASDINYTSGRYDATVKPPFDVGFEVTSHNALLMTAA